MTPFIGEIVMFGGNFAPRGWAFCEGQLLAINSNQALFSILGTTYGGDGRTTFGLPDLRGRVAIGEGHGPGLNNHNLGSRGGTETVTLNTNQIPSHNHMATATVAGEVKVGVNSDGADTPTANGATLTNTAGNVVYNEEDAGNEKLNGISHSLTSTVTVMNQGGSQPHNNMQPYLTVHYIIALQGTFPSRS